MSEQFPVAERRRRFLASVKAAEEANKRFQMEAWVEIENIEDPQCGTSACAAGWAMMDPAVAETGLGALIYVWQSAGKEFLPGGPVFGPDAIAAGVRTMAERYTRPPSGVDIQITYGDKQQFDALEDYLGLPRKAVRKVFDGDAYFVDEDEDGPRETDDIHFSDVVRRIENAFALHPVT
jgi:hypothetical protein